MGFGYYIKNLRKSKELTLKELSQDLMSISFLSKFERNETEITFSYLLDLLNRLNIGFDEFINITEYNFAYKELLKELNLAYSNNNIIALKYLYNKELELYNKNKLRFHYLNSIMIKSIIYNIDQSFGNLDIKEAEAISEFLMGVDYFGDYEISIFGNSLICLEYSTTLLILTEIQKKIDTSYMLADDLRLKLIHVALNIVTISFEQGKMEDMKYVLGITAKLIGKRQLYFEINKLNYLKGIFEYSYGNKEKGKELLETAIRVMDFLGDQIGKQNHLMYLNAKLDLDLKL
ncbi:helix-turn-helix domain-containing protein [Lysinibacillus capsici]|uniref:helix-turn-helix domain-containing protein n=1 Tax=Lysinibacillus capsici TaxID=2115968 RepID=UPI0030819C91|nr:helix-turn-helix domain-containing protein [Lysinibacillus capsici]